MKTRFLFAFLLFALTASAQSFDKYFTNKTLRVDYIFSGNATEQHIAVDCYNEMPGWYGKRVRLSALPMEGNGQITMRDKASGEVIYKNSFSTLFQEWLNTPEAAKTTRSFENVFLLPMPKNDAEITIDLRNNRREITASLTETFSPTDILIRKIGEKPTPYETLVQAKDTNQCIHIAFIAEGYTDAEMPIFIEDANIAIDALFAHEPFKSMRERFNIVAVKSPSTDSGTSIPHKGIWKKTALHSHFDTFYMNRYLTTLNLKTLHDWLAGTPYEHIIVLVNTSNYGGGGILNSYNLSMTHHKKYRPVVVHEFGHSFAGLADEYAYEQEQTPTYPHDIEPWEQNITTLVDFDAKWKDLVKKKTPIPTPEPQNAKDSTKAGVYEGAGYNLKGIYRAYPDCRMRTNENPEFCTVCRRIIQNVIDFYTTPE